MFVVVRLSPSSSEHAQAMQGQRLLQPLLEAAYRALIEQAQFPLEFVQFAFRLLVGRLLIRACNLARQRGCYPLGR